MGLEPFHPHYSMKKGKMKNGAQRSPGCKAGRRWPAFLSTRHLSGFVRFSQIAPVLLTWYPRVAGTCPCKPFKPPCSGGLKPISSIPTQLLRAEPSCSLLPQIQSPVSSRPPSSGTGQELAQEDSPGSSGNGLSSLWDLPHRGDLHVQSL